MTATDPPIVRFDTTDPVLVFHDVDLFREVQAAGGIAWTPEQGGLWVVADHELCRTIAGDHTRFSSAEGIRFPRAGNPKIFALEYDRPRHTQHRAVLTDLVGPRAVGALQPMVRAHARRLLGDRRDGATFDLGTGFAYPFPLEVIFSLIGAPQEFKAEMEVLVESLFLYRRPMPDGSDPARRLDEILDAIIAERSAAPDESWVSSVLQRAAAHTEGLSDEEVRGALVAVLTGGHHSTARGVACLLARIASDPRLQEQLRADPSRIPAVAEESLRLDTPLRWFARTALEDARLAGQQIRAGDRVYLLFAAANRDPARFPEPEQFRAAGSRSSEHLAFGWGIHRCVGMPLAQLELLVAVEEVLATSDWIALDGQIEWTSLVDPRHIPVRNAQPGTC